MTTATDAGTEIDSDVLEALDFEPEEPTCDYVGCEEVATHTLVCGICGQGREFMCTPHAEATSEAQREAPFERVVFDNTCKHAPFFETCQITPL